MFLAVFRFIIVFDAIVTTVLVILEIRSIPPDVISIFVDLLLILSNILDIWI